MNELDHLRRLRADVPEAAPEELALRTGWRPGGSERAPRARPVNPLLPLALSGGALLVAAAVFAFLVLFPAGGPDTVVAGPADESSEEEDRGGDRTAAEVMAPVIEAARSGAPDGPVWYERVVYGNALGVGPEGDRYGVYALHTLENWTDMERESAVGRAVSADWALMAEDDREAWERDGSPTRWTGVSGSLSGEVPETGGVYGVLNGPRSPDFPLGTQNLTVEQLRRLPSDPAELAEMLRTGYRGPGSQHEAEPVRSVLPYPLPPDVRAGVYAVLADIPGVRVLEGVTDVSGRTAVGVAYDVDRGDLGSSEHRILLDPRTGLPLSVEEAVVEPAAADADWAEPGDVLRYWLYESIGWTEEWPQ
ncbi:MULTISPECIES: CU044_5270 family protein [unclassified Nocardiopsis]|uniref:CU044_5270 family protein n=1 Tax=unclassified Nocardiopsis TaxID=2649073 RepID=UPI001358A309|nr:MULTISPECIES: CU044_5270 family protein [unclassified Nocardiopsis]